MEFNSWSNRLSTSSRRHQTRSDLFVEGHEGTDGDDDLKAEFMCPFCTEDFDVVGLCCHMDEEHPVESKNGVCPVCTKRVGADFVSHITMQHGSFFKVQRKRRLRKGGSNLTFALLRKELREGNFQALLGGSSGVVPSSSTEADPLLSSFISNLPTVNEIVSAQSLTMDKASSVKEGSDKFLQQRNVQQSAESDKDQEEKARKCKFVQGLVMSTILEDDF